MAIFLKVFWYSTTAILRQIKIGDKTSRQDGSKTNNTKDTRMQRRVPNIQQKPAGVRTEMSSQEVDVKGVIGIRILSDHVGCDK